MQDTRRFLILLKCKYPVEPFINNNNNDIASN